MRKRKRRRKENGEGEGERGKVGGGGRKRGDRRHGEREKEEQQKELGAPQLSPSRAPTRAGCGVAAGTMTARRPHSVQADATLSSRPRDTSSPGLAACPSPRARACGRPVLLGPTSRTHEVSRAIFTNELRPKGPRHEQYTCLGSTHESHIGTHYERTKSSGPTPRTPFFPGPTP